MYPIRIFGIRVHPDNQLEYALYDDAAREDSPPREPITRFASIDDCAANIARVLFAIDRETAILCAERPHHIHNLLAFSALPTAWKVDGLKISAMKRLSADERIQLLSCLHDELRSVKAENND